MNSEQVSGLVRHLMTAFGGIAIAKGYTDSGTVELGIRHGRYARSRSLVILGEEGKRGGAGSGPMTQ